MRNEEQVCFNHNCTSSYANLKADQIVNHLKEYFPIGHSIYGCTRCCGAVNQVLQAKELRLPPTTTCQICAGINGSELSILLFSNGDNILWVCTCCADSQSLSLQSNFFVSQISIASRKIHNFHTFELPPIEIPKKREYSSSEEPGSPPFKKRPIFVSTPTSYSSKSQSGEPSATNAINQQERRFFFNFFNFPSLKKYKGISAAMEQLQILQNQQQLNLKNIQAFTTAMSDYEVLKESNSVLQEKISVLSQQMKAIEEQKNTIQPLIDRMREGITTVQSSDQILPIVSLLDCIQEALQNSTGSSMDSNLDNNTTTNIESIITSPMRT